MVDSENSEQSDGSIHDDRPNPVGSSRTANIIIGGIVGLVLSFIPFSTALGGAVSGYLEAGSTRDGAVVGTLAGLVMILPMILFGLSLSIMIGIIGAEEGMFLIGGFLLLVIPYTVIPSATGGWLGAYIYQKDNKYGK